MEDKGREIHDAFNKEDQYIGNIWGWKFSWISLGIILFFISLAALRYGYLKYTGEWEKVQEQTEIIDESQ